MFKEWLIWCNEHDMTRNGDWKTPKAMQEQKQTKQFSGVFFHSFLSPYIFHSLCSFKDLHQRWYSVKYVPL